MSKLKKKTDFEGGPPPNFNQKSRVEVITTSKSEKLLGLVCNDNLTWKNHIHGDTENKGLLTELSKRIGALKTLRRYLNDEKFRQIVSGIFTSKLILARIGKEVGCR